MRHRGGRSNKWLYGMMALAGLTFGAAAPAHADTSIGGAKLQIGGYINYNFTVFDQRFDEPGFDNDQVRNAEADGEIDFEATWSWAVARFDLNLPADGNEGAGLSSNSDDIGIEQLYVSYMPEFAKSFGLSITGGAWNAPIGYESQDIYENPTISRSQLFSLVPSNMLGVKLSTQYGRVSWGVYMGNEWRADTAEDMSFGFHSSFAATDFFQVSANAIFISDATSTGSLNDSGDNYLLNGIITLEPHPCFSSVFETDWDENNLGFAAWLIGHHEVPLPYQVTLRYDQVISANNSVYVENFVSNTPALTILVPDSLLRHTTRTYTAGASIEPLPNLKLRTEGMLTDFQEHGGAADERMWTYVIGASYKF